MTVRGAAFLGIGAMVGAGIFALLGEAGTVAGSAVWLSFLLAGIVAALLGYNVVKLGVRYPSSGGLIAYLLEGFGNGRLVGISSWLGYFAAIVIVCSMVAVAFGSYATSLFIGNDAAAGWDNVFTSAIVVAMAGINLIGARFVDRAQSLIVVVLLAVFAVFIVATLVDIDPHLLAFSGYPAVSDIIASVALTFFAYLGFSVITFAVGDLRDPARELPKAMYLALGVTSVTYVLIALGVFGTLTVTEVVGYGETAIAEAARPTLGDAGFTIMADRRAARHGILGERDALRLRGPDGDAGRRRPVPTVLRARLTAWLEGRVADYLRDRARRLQSRRSLRDRLRGQRLLARDLPARRHGRLPATVVDWCPRRDRPAAGWRRPPSCSASSRSTRFVTHRRHSWPSSRSLRSGGSPRRRLEAHPQRTSAIERRSAADAASPDLGDRREPPRRFDLALNRPHRVIVGPPG